MTQQADAPDTLDGPRTTGNRLIDAALADLAGNEQLPVSEQLNRLAAAHEVLVQVLDTSRGAVQTPIPGVRPHTGQARPGPA